MHDADELLRSISLNDDKDAFRLLFEQFYAPLCLYAGRFIDHRDTREDLVQEVFFSVWDKRKKISVTTSARNYLTVCIRNSCLGYIRRTGYHRRYVHEASAIGHSYAENPDQVYTLEELRELLDKALAKLPEEYRLAFVMSRFEDKSSTEIAEDMNVSVRTVERYRNKALELLRNDLKEYLPVWAIVFLLYKG